MIPNSTFEVTFNLSTDRKGSNSCILYGGLPELGSGDPLKGIVLDQIDGVYNFRKTIKFNHSISQNQIWYSYCFRPKYGSLIPETIPRRFLPSLTKNANIYDNTDTATSIGDLVIHFTIRCHTNYGQELFIFGSEPEFGNWKTEQAIQLYHTGIDDYWSTDIRLPLFSQEKIIEYKYFIANGPNNRIFEPEMNHTLHISPTTSPSFIEVSDQFRWEDTTLGAYTRAAFINVINKRSSPIKAGPLSPSSVEPARVSLNFAVNCPYVRKYERLLVVGSLHELGNWNAEQGFSLNDGDFPIWRGTINIPRSSASFDYKFVIVDNRPYNERFHNFQNIDGTSREDPRLQWEDGPNRHCRGITSKSVDYRFPSTILINEWYICPKKNLFHGLGIYIPIFSLRSEESVGIGNYSDLKELTDVCNKVGSSLIQILPINDTTDVGDWSDSYPYRQVSCFALHPIYINVLRAIPFDKIPASMKVEIDEKRAYFEGLHHVDYPAVYQFKNDIMKRLFEIIKPTLNTNQHFQQFITNNKHWLQPYALFCKFRDDNGTSDFRRWKEHSTITSQEIISLSAQLRQDLLYTYRLYKNTLLEELQYVADCQFKDARQYANDHGVVLKSDLPIGVFINSVEVWSAPKNFRIHEQAGAPPDDFADLGQNWGFPTYDWDYMLSDNFSWWRARLTRMSELFQALRVDHVLGFFRIWEIPREKCIKGLLGHFFPARPYSKSELEQWGLFDIERYTEPYIRWHMLREKFGDDAADVASKYFISLKKDGADEFFKFKPEYDSEVKIQESVQNDIKEDIEKQNKYISALFQLIEDVLLIPDEAEPDKYHVRIEVQRERIDKSPNGFKVIPSPSFMALSKEDQDRFRNLYHDFVYNRQTQLWIEKAQPKLKMLSEITNMLICVEDLGSGNEDIFDALRKTPMLSLEVQRMAKKAGMNFGDHNNYPYLSVCCPGTHDMPSLRGWWADPVNLPRIQDFWWGVLYRHEECPKELSTYFQEMIIKQHLWSNSMWAIILLQDLTGICEHLRLQYPSDEQINIPSDPNHHWRYRFPYTLRSLAEDRTFTNKLRSLVDQSNRL